MVVLMLAAACVEDVVLPDVDIGGSAAICGNGVREPGEACDLQSPGCVNCNVVPNWSCTDATCVATCVDGGADGGCEQAVRVNPCDMTGYWASREQNAARDNVIGSVQTSSNWFLLRLVQDGDTFHVAESLDCGVHVTGSVTVDSTAGTLSSSMYLNRMDGQGGRPARGGVSKLVGDTCQVSFERFYKVRGVNDSFLPADFSTHPTLASLPALPKSSDPVKDTSTPAGTTDPDGDGIPGTSFRITGFVSGVRNSAQRDWKEFATTPDAGVTPGATEFSVPGSFDLEESVLRVTQCGGACGLIASAASAAPDIGGKIALSFLGRTADAPAAATIIAGPPRSNLDLDLKTCEQVRLLIPHEGNAK